MFDSIEVTVTSSFMDINVGYIDLKFVTGKDSFYESVHQILSEYSSNSMTKILDFTPDAEGDDENLTFEINNILTEVNEPESGMIKIIQVNISKNGWYTFTYDPADGKLIFETETIDGYETLVGITQDGNEIEYEIQDYGSPNEEMLQYVVKFEDGVQIENSISEHFNIDVDMPDEEVDMILKQVTDGWFDEIFNSKRTLKQ